jgi:hypothetical protein
MPGRHAKVLSAAVQILNGPSSQSGGTTIWSRARAANYAALELPWNAGITTFSPVKLPRRVIASFEHDCGPLGLSYPHVRNIVITRLTTWTPTACTSELARAATRPPRWPSG